MLPENDKQTLEDHETVWMGTCEFETLPEVYKIAGSGLEGAANLLLKPCQQNEMEKHWKSNEIECQIQTEIRRKMSDIVEDIYRAWKVSPTPEMVSTHVSGILGECYSFWDEKVEDGLPVTRFEQQDWFKIIQNQLTMY